MAPHSLDSYLRMSNHPRIAPTLLSPYSAHLQALPGIPSGLGLARATVEEYNVRFLEQLKAVLRVCPPVLPSEPAVDLLVAVAELQRWVGSWVQGGISGAMRDRALNCTPDHSLLSPAHSFRYMESNGLALDNRHPGHLNTMALFRGHVISWLRASQVSGRRHHAPGWPPPQL